MSIIGEASGSGRDRVHGGGGVRAPGGVLAPIGGLRIRTTWHHPSSSSSRLQSMSSPRHNPRSHIIGITVRTRKDTTRTSNSVRAAGRRLFLPPLRPDGRGDCRMIRVRHILFLLGALVLGGCATLPTGPSVMVLPAPGKPFEQFQADDAVCRQWAEQQIGLSPQQTANQNTAVGAVAGTAIGAALGAAIGAASGNAGAGAAIGAASGLLGGTAVGANAGQAYGWEAQRRYDISYQQCMYAKGNQIPGVVKNDRRTSSAPPPPPPPPGFGSGPEGPPPSYAAPPPPPPPK
jgi:hypothetical protein